MIWEVTGGEGRLAGATGLITSNFSVDPAGEVVDHHVAHLVGPGAENPEARPLRLPGTDPFELLATLAAHPATKRASIVATTASVLSGEVERCRAAGFADVLIKPISGKGVLDLNARLCAPMGGAGAAQGRFGGIPVSKAGSRRNRPEHQSEV